MRSIWLLKRIRPLRYKIDYKSKLSGQMRSELRTFLINLPSYHSYMKQFYWLVFIVLVFSCSKGSEKEKDYDAPVVTLNTPANNQQFTAGQNITITGSVSDNKYIKEIHMEITNLATAQEYLHVHIHPATNSFNFSQAFTVQAGINYKIRVVADDPSSNSSVKSVEISGN